MVAKIKTRMTGKDYRKELEDLEARKKSLRAHVLKRLKDLIKLYPDAQIHDNDKALTASMLSESFIEAISTTVKIRFIENIERWSEEQQGVQQLKI